MQFSKQHTTPQALDAYLWAWRSAMQDKIVKIRKHVAGVPQLRDQLKCWDYTEVFKVYDDLVGVFESINKLELVPQGFLSALSACVRPDALCN